MGSKYLQKIFVGPNQVVSLKCPNCGKMKSANVERFKGRRAPLSLKCKCQYSFKVFLEFRKAVRKKAHLEGNYTLAREGTARRRIVVQNISRKGLGLTTVEKNDLNPDDELMVQFTLDDKTGAEIEKRVIIRSVEGNYVGCEFIDKDHKEDEFENYLAT